jgi:hypothetical protein
MTPATAAQEVQHLRSHVREALAAHRAGRPEAATVLRRWVPRFKGASKKTILAATLTRAEAQTAVAREHGFPTWGRILEEARKGPKASWNLPLEARVTDPAIREALALVAAGKIRAVASLLKREPDLAARPVRLDASGPLKTGRFLEAAVHVGSRAPRSRRALPQVIRIVTSLDGGRDPRALQQALRRVVAKPWTGAKQYQRQAIRALLKGGAAPGPAMPTALFQGGPEASDELVKAGAPLTLVAAACTGRVAALRRMLPASTGLERRRALALAAVNGQTPVIQALLQAGLDPNQWNPSGYYDHSTPLHQAVWFDHFSTVRVLVEQGADLSIRDKQHDGTPLGWARFGKRDRIARYLRSRQGDDGGR